MADGAYRHKLRPERRSSRAVKGKLRPEAEEAGAGRPPAVRRASVGIAAAAANAARNTVRDAVGRPDSGSEGSSGGDILQSGEAAARTAGNIVDSRHYSRKLRQYGKAEKLGRRSDRTGAESLYQRERTGRPDTLSSPLSRWWQKQELKKRYLEAGFGGRAGASGAAGGGRKAAEKTGAVADRIMESAKGHPQALLAVGASALLIMLTAGLFTSCTAMFAGGGNAVLGTSYTAEDADILGADADYTALEAGLDSRIGRVEAENPGYDEYRYDLAQTGHDPYELASCLTVLLEDYTRAEAQSTLQSLFARQYALTLTPEVEIRTRTETRTGTIPGTDPETGETVTTAYTYEEEVEYEYRILSVELANRGLGEAVRELGLTAGQMERYGVLMLTGGNRPELFGDGDGSDGF